MTGKVLTANRLSDGRSVWLGANGEWVSELRDGFIARHAEAVAALEAAGSSAVADNRVVDVDLIDVEETASGPVALRLRERIRAGGPTIPYGPDAKTRSGSKAA